MYFNRPGESLYTLPAENSNGNYLRYFIQLSSPPKIHVYANINSWDGGKVRYVIIPGGVLGGRSAPGQTVKYSYEQLKEMSYDEIVKVFNIPATGSNN